MCIWSSLRLFVGGEAETGRTHVEWKANIAVRFIPISGAVGFQLQGNAQHSATLLETPLSKLASINKKMAWTTVNNRVLSDSDFSNMNVIRELLYIKHNFTDMTLYSKDEIDFILEYCCTS